MATRVAVRSFHSTGAPQQGRPALPKAFRTVTRPPVPKAFLVVSRPSLPKSFQTMSVRRTIPKAFQVPVQAAAAAPPASTPAAPAAVATPVAAAAPAKAADPLTQYDNHLHFWKRIVN
eukprot:scaffold108813_cov62-Attheya_sp.AAC.1